MEDIRKHLGIDPNNIINDFNDILELAQEALEDEAEQLKGYADYASFEDDPEEFEMDFGSKADEENYGLLQALRRIFK